MTNGDDNETENPMEGLARQYMDLWQDQLKSLSDDPELNSTLAQTMQMLNAGFANMAATGSVMHEVTEAPASQHHDNQQSRQKKGQPPISNGGTGTPATTGFASIDSDPVILELKSRITELEKRVAELEQGSRAPRTKSRKKT